MDLSGDLKIKYSHYQLSDSVQFGGIMTPEQCKELAKKVMSIYDANGDGTLDSLEIAYMQSDCYRAMNKGFNPSPTDIATYSRVIDRNQLGKVDGKDIESLCIKYFGGQFKKDDRLNQQPKGSFAQSLQAQQQDSQVESRSPPIKTNQSNSPYNSTLPAQAQQQGNAQNVQQGFPNASTNATATLNAQNIIPNTAIQQTANQPSSLTQQANNPNLQYVRASSNPRGSITGGMGFQRPQQQQQQQPKEEFSFESKPQQPVEVNQAPPQRPTSRSSSLRSSNDNSEKARRDRIIQERLEVARRIFRMIDTDKSGYLTAAEIPNLLVETYKQMGMSYDPSEEDVELWMQMNDTDGDGKVYIEDYEATVLRGLRQQGIILE